MVHTLDGDMTRRRHNTNRDCASAATTRWSGASGTGSTSRLRCALRVAGVVGFVSLRGVGSCWE